MLGQMPLSSVHRYDVCNDKWEANWSSMPTPRYSHSSVVANGRLYIVGGKNEDFEVGGATRDCSDPTQQMPVLDLTSKTWLGGAVLPGPSADTVAFVWKGQYLITFPTTKSLH